MLRISLWRLSCTALLGYVLIAGLMMPVPRLPILNETIRVLYFHVPMWFGMVILFGVSAFYAMRHLREKTSQSPYVVLSFSFAKIGFLFGLMGVLTGMVWAYFTWGTAWSNDPKQIASALSLLTYGTYFLLSNIKGNPQEKMGAIHNVICFFTMLSLLFIMPRFTDSLHPGNGGNPGFNVYDLNSQLRVVFYPAVVGWTLLGVWLTTIEISIQRLQNKIKAYHNQ